MRRTLRAVLGLCIVGAGLSLLLTIGLASGAGLGGVEPPLAAHAMAAVLSGFLGAVLLNFNWWITVGVLGVAFTQVHRQAVATEGGATR